MTAPSQRSGLPVRHGCFVLLVIAALALFRNPVSALASLAVHDERYSYIAFIPFISAFLIYLDSGRIFRDSSSSRALAAGVASLAIGAFWIFRGLDSSPNAAVLPLLIASLVVLWIGLFTLCYGAAASKIAAFPLLFLVLCVPPPAGVMGGIVVALQRASADMSYLLFKALGVPVLRQGFVFSLPGLDIEVAEQCSGIRSSLSLLIAGILASHLVLHSTWKKICLSLLTIPIVIAKNALRIVVLALLGAYVDREILFGRMHKNSGLLFSPLSLLVMAWFLFMLYRSEKKRSAVDAKG